MFVIARLLALAIIAFPCLAARAAEISAVQMPGRVDSVDWSPDGRWIVAVTNVKKTKEHVVYLVDTNAGGAKEVLFKSDKPLFSPVFSSNGEKLAVGIWDYVDGGDQSAVLLWDLQDRKQQRVFHFAARTDLGVDYTSDVLTLEFSPDGRRLAAGTKLVGQYPIAGTHIGGEVCVWNVDSAELLWFDRSTHSDIVYDVAFSPDGRMLASAGYDKVIRLWEPGSGKLVRSLFGAGWYGVSTVCFVRGGAVIITGGSGVEEGAVLRSWDLESAKQLAVVTASDTEFTRDGTCRVRASPVGKTIYAIGNTDVGESPEWQLQTWSASLQRWSRKTILKQPGFARDVDLTADEQRLAVALFEGGILIVELREAP